MVVSVVSGCTFRGPVIPPPALKAQYTYRVGPGDVLFLEVFGETDLAREVVVSPDGTLTYPLAGIVDVMDMTLAEVAEAVRRKLIERQVFADPEALSLTVTLRQSRSNQVLVLGEVGQQGPMQYMDRMSLLQALGATQVLWETAKIEDVRIVRGALDDPELIEVDLHDVFVAADKDVFLQPGDIVVVPPKHITRINRYLNQLLGPIRNISGTTFSVASSAARVAQPQSLVNPFSRANP